MTRSTRKPQTAAPEPAPVVRLVPLDRPWTALQVADYQDHWRNELTKEERRARRLLDPEIVSTDVGDFDINQAEFVQ